MILAALFVLYTHVTKPQLLSYDEIEAQYYTEKPELESCFYTHFRIPECLQTYVTQDISIELDHLFLPTLYYKKQQGMYISGFHHDYLEQISQCEAFYGEKTKITQDDFYAAYISGTGYKQGIPPTQKWYKTFFPSSWTRIDVIKKICKVLSKSKIDLKRSTQSKIALKGFYNKNTAFIGVFDVQKQSFVSIYIILYGQS
jgi:hypothetical protein